MSWLTACGFSIPAAENSTLDAPVGDADARLDGSDPNPCLAPDPTGLIACYQFENPLSNGAGVFVDQSGNGRDATVAGFTAVTRAVNTTSEAIMVGASASALVPQSAGFDLTGSFTLSAWILPINPDPGGNEGINDHEGQWAMSILNGQLAC